MSVIEEQTQDQSECPLWKEMRKPRVTASRFHEASHVRGETSGQALARRILKGTKQTQAMKTGLDKEPEVLERYSDLFNVNVSPCGFVAHLIVFCVFCTSYCFALFIALHILLLFLFFYHIYALVLCYFI